MERSAPFLLPEIIGRLTLPVDLMDKKQVSQISTDGEYANPGHLDLLHTEISGMIISQPLRATS